MKLDENLPAELAADLRQLRHDVETVADERLCGATDPEVLRAAHSAGRILLTLDKGIANLQRYPLNEHAGVVLFRPDKLGRSTVLEFVRARLQDTVYLELKGHLVIVGPDRIRFR